MSNAPITSPFWTSWKSPGGGSSMHNGIDLSVDEDSVPVPKVDGVVDDVGCQRWPSLVAGNCRCKGR